MAEFCVDCWEKYNGNMGYDVVLSSKYDLDLCEGCGEYKRVVIGVRTEDEMLMRFLFLPIVVVYEVLKSIYFFIRYKFDEYKDNKE